MEIKVLGTGSTGNAYLVESGGTTLLLDCGLPWKQMQKASGFRVTDARACLITHEHGDHAKAAADVVANGIPLISSEGTFGNLPEKVAAKIPIYMERNIIPMADAPALVGNLHVKALRVEHDAADPLAYLIRNPQTDELLLYATDTPYLEYNVRGLTHLMIEANYSTEYMVVEDRELNERVIRTHMSIDALEEWLRTGEARKTLREIWLLHMSESRSNESEFKRRIQAICGCEVYVA